MFDKGVGGTRDDGRAGFRIAVIGIEGGVVDIQNGFDGRPNCVGVIDNIGEEQPELGGCKAAAEGGLQTAVIMRE